jgi:hypothetical protein
MAGWFGWDQNIRTDIITYGIHGPLCIGEQSAKNCSVGLEFAKRSNYKAPIPHARGGNRAYRPSIR